MSEVLVNVKQTKEEAEMAQVDWLLEIPPLLKPAEACASSHTRFSMAYLWKRAASPAGRHFDHDVFVIL